MKKIGCWGEKTFSFNQLKWGKRFSKGARNVREEKKGVTALSLTIAGVKEGMGGG